MDVYYFSVDFLRYSCAFWKIVLNSLDTGTKSDTVIVYIYDKDKITSRKCLTARGCSAIGQKHEYTLAFCNAVETILLLVYTRYGRSVLVIVRQVNASPDMRRAARISMYRGITHLRQIISSLNYIFPRRTPVAARIYFAFTSSIDENKNRISRPFSASPLHRLRAAVSRSHFSLCKLPSVRFLCVSHEKTDCQECMCVVCVCVCVCVCMCVFNSQSFFLQR